MRHEIICPFQNLSTYEKILGVPIYSEELQWILYRHVFAHVLWIKITQIRACCQLLRTLIALLKGEQVIKMLGKMSQIWWHRKFGDSMLQNASTRENARACACPRFFLEMLEMAWNVCKKYLGWFGAFSIFARALTCARTRTRAFAHAYWPEIDRTDIDLNHV